MGRKKDNFDGIYQKFDEINEEYETEILELYATLTEPEPDFYLKLLDKFFKKLKIPKCFTTDILECVEYFYDVQGTLVTSNNSKRDITLLMINTFTITSTSQVHSDDDIIDIVDIDKLIKYTNKLLQFRDNFDHIKQSWQLFVEGSRPPSDDGPRDINPLDFKLSVPGLKNVKSYLNLDSNPKQQFSDAFLIDMLSCCSSDHQGNLYNFDLHRQQQGLCIGIKDFAYILGTLGEYQ